MKEQEIKVKYEDEAGNVFNMIKLKEFSHNEKRYAVLQEEKTCDHECDCCDENLALLEVTTDKDGKEKFVTIKNEKLFKEVVDIAEALFEE